MNIHQEYIGPEDQRHHGSQFTEVLIKVDGQLLAHFCGPFAKRISNHFINSLAPANGGILVRPMPCFFGCNQPETILRKTTNPVGDEHDTRNTSNIK